ncbi:hypothetical protein APHAL10511_005555 [Amanita phalloides]|nr:hypothetical protein APHAL10511_005555 [Amanita phalloides]
MRSFLSRCSLIFPLVCALTVASQDLFTVRSVKNGHCVSKHAIAPEYNVTAASCVEATHLKIHPLPNRHDILVTASFKSVTHDLYIGLEGEPGSSINLVWVPHEYKWQIGLVGDGIYVIKLDELHLYWFDGYPHAPSGPVELVAPNVYTPLPTLVWNIEPVKHCTDGHRLP